MSERHRPWLAALMSLFVAGTGQLYCGSVRRGMTLFALYSVSTLLLCVTAAVGRGPVGFAALVAAPVVAVLVTMIAAVDAYRLARRGPRPEATSTFQRPSGYLLLVVVGLALPLSATGAIERDVLHAYVLPTLSMAPALQPGDRVLANSLRPRLAGIERGDLVVFRDRDSGEFFIKRVIGLPGETVQVSRGDVLIDGVPLPHEADGAGVVRETAGAHTYTIAAARVHARPTQVPPDSYFVLGDNRTASKDSRYFGPVAGAQIAGCVEYLYWTADGFARVGPVD